MRPDQSLVFGLTITFRGSQKLTPSSILMELGRSVACAKTSALDMWVWASKQVII